MAVFSRSVIAPAWTMRPRHAASLSSVAVLSTQFSPVTPAGMICAAKYGNWSGVVTPLTETFLVNP